MYRQGWNHDVTIYSRDEYKQDLCKQKYPSARYVLGDVRDLDRLTLAMSGHDIVIHTAAIKYIPEAEFNVSECIDVNVQGSRNVFTAARRSGVATVIAISTDKVVQPVNVYGATKMIMERLVGEASHHDGPFYAACRYGNVVGSTGSVIPLFQRQMKEQGYITVTDPTMTRYFISVDEAIELIFSCFGMHGGSIRIPTPRAMLMGDLALAIAQHEDNIRYIGKRPGEKHHEQMLSRDESLRAERQGSLALYSPVHYELHRVGSTPIGEPFSMSSDSASAIGVQDMQAIVEDAINV
jgi:UDP-N-acetylglucosamine 4,6-dehydratase